MRREGVWMRACHIICVSHRWLLSQRPGRPSLHPPSIHLLCSYPRTAIISLPTLRPLNDESAQSEEHPPKPRSGCAASQAAWSNVMQGWPRREPVLHHINQKTSSRLYSVLCTVPVRFVDARLADRSATPSHGIPSRRARVLTKNMLPRQALQLRPPVAAIRSSPSPNEQRHDEPCAPET